jgi:hypothetical protein
VTHAGDTDPHEQWIGMIHTVRSPIRGLDLPVALDRTLSGQIRDHRSGEGEMSPHQIIIDGESGAVRVIAVTVLPAAVVI